MRVGKEKISLLPSLYMDLSRFQKEKLIGKGSFSEVFMATDKITGNKVALKKLNFDSEESE